MKPICGLVGPHQTHNLKPHLSRRSGPEEEAFYLNYVAAELVCEAVDAVPGRGLRRFVLGQVRDRGWHASPAEVEWAVTLQVEALIAGASMVSPWM